MGANETILIKLDSHNSQATGPKTWVFFRISFLIYDNGNTVIKFHTCSIFTFEFFTSTAITVLIISDYLRGIFNIASITMTIITSPICAYFRLLAPNTQIHIFSSLTIICYIQVSLSLNHFFIQWRDQPSTEEEGETKKRGRGGRLLLILFI